MFRGWMSVLGTLMLFSGVNVRAEATVSFDNLIQALKDEDKDVRDGAVIALIKIGEPAVEPLIKALKYEKDWIVRVNAAHALGRIGDKRAVEPLIQALKDKDKDVRFVQEKAREALVVIGKPAVEPLIQALKDEDEEVQRGAAEALEKIKANE